MTSASRLGCRWSRPTASPKGVKLPILVVLGVIKMRMPATAITTDNTLGTTA